MDHSRFNHESNNFTHPSILSPDTYSHHANLSRVQLSPGLLSAPLHQAKAKTRLLPSTATVCFHSQCEHRLGLVAQKGFRSQRWKRLKWCSWKGVALCGLGEPPIAIPQADEEGSYPHTPHAPTPSSILVWEQASEALLTPDETIVYQPKEMEEFAGGLGGSRGVKGWMRGWVEGRNLASLAG